jgi:serine/threonine protein phosphatase 1
MPGQAEAKPLELAQPTVPEDTLVYAIGDIHGCVELLKTLHEEIRRDADAANCARRVAVYLGDYVDRGPSSKEVVDLLLEKPLDGFEHHFLMGNHEAFLIEFLDDIEAGPGWLFNGGVTTLRSYGIDIDDSFAMTVPALTELQKTFTEKLPKEHRAFYEALEYNHQEGDYFFVHAGIRPGVPLDAQDNDDMLWIREEFLLAPNYHGKIIVHGHTISWDPEIKANRIGIDTGAFTSGVLTGLALEGHEQDVLTAVGTAA